MLSRFKKKKQKHPHAIVPIVLGGICLLLVAGVLVVANLRMYQKKRELDYQIKSLENKIQGMRQKNTQLEQGIAKSDDEQYIEKVAREELDLQKPGEQVVSFVQTGVEVEAAGAQQTFWQAWMGWASGMFFK